MIEWEGDGTEEMNETEEREWDCTRRITRGRGERNEMKERKRGKKRRK